jgi:short subunit dehydrogenase-like uncharacterized protein
MKSSIVAVYGATGHTGRFVVAALERRGAAIRRIGRQLVSQNNRDPDTWFSASCDDPDALDRALKGVDAVINCAGPFLDTAPAIIEAALRAGAHYLDIAAEQRSVRQSLATYNAEAIDRGVVVLPAMAFYGGLADLLAAQACTGLQSVNEILIAVALDHWHPTAGTRRTGERNTARRVIVSEGRLTPLPTQSGRRWRFPLPFGDLAVTAVPLSEIVTISHHIAAKRIESFMNEAPLQDLKRTDTPPPAPVNGKSSQTFVMEVIASGNGTSRRIAAFGTDIYAISAPLVVEACMRILQGPATGGTFAPAQLFDAQDFLTALKSDLRVESISQHHPVSL